MENILENYKVQFEMVKQCKHLKTKDLNLVMLLNSMENQFEIPCFNDESFNKNNLEIITLYREIGNERSFMKSEHVHEVMSRNKDAIFSLGY